LTFSRITNVFSRELKNLRNDLISTQKTVLNHQAQTKNEISAPPKEELSQVIPAITDPFCPRVRLIEKSFPHAKFAKIVDLLI
jgi:hypothetical protein